MSSHALARRRKTRPGVELLESRALLSALSASLTTDQTVYQVGQPIQMTFTETNTSNQPINVDEGPSIDGFDVTHNGAPVWESNWGINPMVLVARLRAWPVINFEGDVERIAEPRPFLRHAGRHLYGHEPARSPGSVGDVSDRSVDAFPNAAYPIARLRERRDETTRDTRRPNRLDHANPEEHQWPIRHDFAELDQRRIQGAL